eukprot:scaffold7368_cov144-Skeletonema_menzelii.AAC.12
MVKSFLLSTATYCAIAVVGISSTTQPAVTAFQIARPSLVHKTTSLNHSNNNNNSDGNDETIINGREVVVGSSSSPLA